MVRRLMFGMLAVFMLLGGAMLLVNVWAQAPKQAQIVFVSMRDGDREIYVMDADGKNQRNLTNDPESDINPAWSPDGQKIAFTSARDWNAGLGWEIYVMDAEGNNPRNLTNDPDNAGISDWFDPAFVSVSPAGKLKGTWGQVKQASKGKGN